MLKELIEHVGETEVKDLKLYFITRILKPGVKKRSKALDKYDFNLYRVDIDEEIRKHLYDLTGEQLNKLQKKNYEIIDYDVISEDSQQFFSYNMRDSKLAFADVIYDKLPNESKIKPIKNLESIINNEDIWAYCVGLEYEEKWFYSFRKIIQSKVAVDEKENHKKSPFKAIRAKFSTESNKLELLHGETINLDKQIDCVYFDDSFYVFKKTNFETLTCMAEEFKEQAVSVFKELEDSNMIEGIEILGKQVKENPAIHKKLVRLKKIGQYQNLDKESVAKMQEVADTVGEKFKSIGGKVLIEDVKDVDSALKMLCDYYKKGMVSDKNYGTYAGKQLNLN